MRFQVRAAGPRSADRRWTAITATALVLVLVIVAALVGKASGAQASDAERSYEISNLDSLGGNFAAGNSVNNAGWVAGRESHGCPQPPGCWPARRTGSAARFSTAPVRAC